MDWLRDILLLSGTVASVYVGCTIWWHKRKHGKVEELGRLCAIYHHLEGLGMMHPVDIILIGRINTICDELNKELKNENRTQENKN